MYAMAVNVLGLNPHFVLDDMEMYELAPLLDKSHYRHKSSWEQARFVAYITALCNSSKKLSIDDICTFPWEKEKEKEEQETEIDMEEIENIKKVMNKITNGK